MKITVNSKALLEALSSLKPVATNYRLPVCDNVWISSSQQTVTATNTRDTIIKRLEFTGDINALIPFKPLYDLVKTIPEQEISISVNEKSISIAYDSGRTRLGIANTIEEYPRIPDVSNPDLIVDLSSDYIQAIAKKVATFAGVEEHAEPHFNGVYFFFSKSHMYSIGADGKFKIAHLSHELPEGFLESEMSYLVDLQTAHLLAIFEQNDSVAVSFKGNYVQFESTDLKLIGRLSEYGSQKFSQILAYNSQKTFRVHRRQILSIVKRIQSISNTELIGLTYESGLMHLEAENKGLGSFIKEKIAVESEATESVRVAVKMRLLIDSLSCIDSEFVWIAFDGEKCPFEAMGDTPDYKSLLQPIQYWQPQEV